MGFLKKLFGIKDKNKGTLSDVSCQSNVSLSNKIEEKTTTLNISDSTILGNLNFEGDYLQTIEEGERLLKENPTDCMVYINLMESYFKLRNRDVSYFDKSTECAKLAILYGHNTGYAHKRLLINLIRCKQYHKALQLCEIVTNPNFHFSLNGMGRINEYMVYKARLKSRIKKALDKEGDLIYSSDEVKIIFGRIAREDSTLSQRELESLYRHIDMDINDKDAALKIQKIEGTFIKPKNNFPTERIAFQLKEKPIGDFYEEAKLNFPEFHFYTKEGDEDFFYNSKNEIIWHTNRLFKQWLEEAKSYEVAEDYINAIAAYEKVVANHCYLVNGYDRLIKLYAKAKLKDVEKEVIREAIEYFSTFRQKQKKYILKIAHKYDKVAFTQNRINKKQKIYYFNGAFELYNPYPMIERWVDRLTKLEKS